MTAKEYLDQYRKSQYRADRLYERYIESMESIDSVGSSSNYDVVHIGKSAGISPTEKKAIQLSMKLDKWRNASLDALELRQEVFGLIYDIPGYGGDILYERYILLKNWEDVCDALSLSWSTVRSHHIKALDTVQERMEERNIIKER